MKHAPNFEDEPKQSDTEDWLQEWANERKLTPAAAHDMLRSTFQERLTYWREQGSDSWPWVVPFYYNHVDADSIVPVGGLWIPDKNEQELVDRVGAYIHIRLLMDMYRSVENTGMETSVHHALSRIDLSTEVPQILVDSRTLPAQDWMRQQIERDFGVTMLAR